MSATAEPDPVIAFEPHRRRLTALAYRMLGSVAEAEDVVQEAYLRWHATDRAAVADPRAFLSKIVSRLCVDHLRSARVRRETYVGPWLPEPVLDAAALNAETASEYAEDLTVALMLALERLSPLERAAFLLHDVSSPPARASISGPRDRAFPSRKMTGRGWPRPFSMPPVRATPQRWRSC